MRGRRAVALLAVACFAIGCASAATPSPATEARPVANTAARGLIVTRAADLNDNDTIPPPAASEFLRGEVPSFFAYGYGGERLTMKVVTHAGAVVMFDDTRRIPEHMDYHWTAKLPPGEYEAQLIVDDAVRHIAVFKVLR